MLVLVTGGSGLLGNNILRRLSALGHQAMALIRDRPAAGVFDGVDVEPVLGTLADREVIHEAVGRCDAVIHSAGLIHIGWNRLEESMAVNRDGTAAIVESAIAHRRKLVHVGTVDTLSLGTTARPADESSDAPPPGTPGGKVPCSYVLSKRAGVEVVRQGVKEGLAAAIVHPGFMLGPWDWKPSSGRMAVEVGRVWRPVCPSGGCSVCDVRDVADATIAAIERGGEEGREYILAGENWTYRRLWQELAQRMGRRGPLMKLGPAQRWVAGRIGDAVARLTGNEGDINSASIQMSTDYHYYDSSRAVAELDYDRRPIEQTLDDAVQWLKKQHLSHRR